MGLLKRIYVNKQIIAKNVRQGFNNPPLSVLTYKGVTPGHTVEVEGPSTIIHSPLKANPAGARVWIETRSRVVVDGQEVV